VRFLGVLKSLPKEFGRVLAAAASAASNGVWSRLQFHAHDRKVLFPDQQIPRRGVEARVAIPSFLRPSL